MKTFMFFLITKRALCQKVQFTLSSVTLRYLIRKFNTLVRDAKTEEKMQQVLYLPQTTETFR